MARRAEPRARRALIAFGVMQWQAQLLGVNYKLRDDDNYISAREM
jgi:hypothetical protein